MALPVGVQYLLLGAGIAGLLYAMFGKRVKKRAAIGAVSAIVGVFGLVMLLPGWGVNLGDFFTAAPAEEGDQGGVASGVAIPIKTLNVLVEEKNSGSFSAADGTLKIYRSGTNPSDANANPLDSVTVTNGNGTSTSGVIKTNTKYRVVLDGSTTYYDVDLGEIEFVGSNYDKDQGQYLLELVDSNAAIIVPTISDAFDETTAANFNGQTTANLSGTSGNVVGNMGTISADGTWYWNETAGTTAYIEITPAFTGANAEVKEAVLCFDWDDSNPPEGNEFSDMTASLRTGTNYQLPSDILDYFNKEACIPLVGAKAGDSGTYRISMTITAANFDTADDFTIKVDDLGKVDGKDVLLGTKATKDTITFGGSYT